MAQKTILSFIDDLDGTESDDVSTVLFGLDGIEYEIELSEANADKLRASLEEFVNSARRTGGRRKGPASLAGVNGHRKSGAPDPEVQAIRDWARDNGIPVADRGRVAASVRERYNEAKHAAASESAEMKPPATRRKRTAKAKATA